MEQIKEQKHSKIKKGLATALAFITLSATIFGALSIFKPNNVVFAEQIVAEVSKYEEETIQINVSTQPVDANKEFAVYFSKQKTDNSPVEDEAIENFLTYEIDDNYNYITVKCLKPFNGKVLMTIENIESKIKGYCTFRFKQEIEVENSILAFQQREGDSTSPLITDKTYYMNGYEARGFDSISSDVNFQNEIENKLLFDACYTMVSQVHGYSKGDVSNDEFRYWNFIVNESALNSLNEYASTHKINGVTYQFSFNEDENVYAGKRLAIFRFTNILLFENGSNLSQNSYFYTILQNWMKENPTLYLFSIKHNDNHISHFFNICFKTDINYNVANSVTPNIDDYIFNS